MRTKNSRQAECVGHDIGSFNGRLTSNQESRGIISTLLHPKRRASVLQSPPHIIMLSAGRDPASVLGESVDVCSLSASSPFFLDRFDRCDKCDR